MHKLSYAILVASTITLTGTATAASERTCSYVYDSAGMVVRDSAGDCVRTSGWRPEGAIAECEPDMKKPEPVAEPEPEPAPVPAPQPVYKTVNLGAGALFDLNSDALRAEGKRELDQLVSDLGQLSDVQSIQIAGHTDSTGDAAYNKDLSVRRANAVKNYLLEKGVDPSIMTTVGWGETKPIADNSTRAGRAQNRRVEITISGEQRVQ
ncbi:membrane protein [Thiohalobacter sp. COW1]|uniref:OmpA family protein n=1 Tax=Thiohalobacter sp. COW1 TaxID=2795687 RepID=UPI001915AD7D|nr:OmpA family protein [Thiohalobacter sp. COW1]BCO30350.1 membrane protein [Thiohalobacter sp. COW1]